MQLDLTFGGLDCIALNATAKRAASFLEAVEMGILKAMGDSRLTRDHVVTRWWCGQVLRLRRRLQANDAVRTQTTIHAGAATVPVEAVRASLQNATEAGELKTAVESSIQSMPEIAAVQASGATASMGMAVAVAVRTELATSTSTTTAPPNLNFPNAPSPPTRTTTRNENWDCNEEICVEKPDSKAAERLSLPVIAASLAAALLF